MNSHNHIMLGSIDAWFYRILAGLSPLEAGWRKARIKPHILGDLKHATATHQTVRGEFHVSWEKEEALLKLFVSVPAGSSADLFVPVFGEESSIRENDTIIWKMGKPAENIEGITSLKAMDSYVSMNVGSGFYAFEIQG